MKKLIYCFAIIVLLVFVATSCDNEEPIQTSDKSFPLKFIQDGVMQLELIFDTEGKLTRLNAFTNGKLSSYYLYEYTAQGISEARRYSVNNGYLLDITTVFTLDDLGRIIKTENRSKGEDGNAIVMSSVVMKYDPSGRLIRRQLKFVGDPIFYIDEFTYGVNNLCTKRETTYHPNQPMEYSIRVEYVPGDKDIHEHWSDFMPLLLVSGVEESIWNMFYTSIHKTLFGEDKTIVIDYVASAGERQFNTNGFLTRQVWTYENLKDVQADLTYQEERFEYTE